MGISMFRCRVYKQNSTVDAPNPDPLNFKVLTVRQVGRNLVARIQYPDCTNYEGIKVCVFKDMNELELMCLDSIDPHFSESKQSPFARFKPTVGGWNTAIMLAKNI